MSAALLIQGLQARVVSLEARERRSDTASRVDAFEREMINLHNSIDVLRMTTVTDTQSVQSQLDNVVVASLRGAVDGICKREVDHSARLASIEALMKSMTAAMQSLHKDKAGEDFGAQITAVREASAAATVTYTLAQSSLATEIANLKGAIDLVTRTAFEHARAGRADIDALRSEIEHLKAQARTC
jgi:hypothetical protein